jgi:hypothetical protein
MGREWGGLTRPARACWALPSACYSAVRTCTNRIVFQLWRKSAVPHSGHYLSAQHRSFQPMTSELGSDSPASDINVTTCSPAHHIYSSSPSKQLHADVGLLYGFRLIAPYLEKFDLISNHQCLSQTRPSTLRSRDLSAELCRSQP